MICYLDKIRTIKGPFQLGKIYSFNLTVTANSYDPVTTIQIITVVTSDDPNLKIL